MEADEYFSTYDAIHDKKKNIIRRQLPLQTNECCGIMKIVWSQFDFMTGPELKFVWELTPSTSLSPANLSGEECSIADAESLVDSNGSNQSVIFEEIDDPLKAELTLLNGLDESLLVDPFSAEDLVGGTGDFHYKTMVYLDEYMTDSRTTCTTTSTRTLTNDDSRFFESPDSSAKSLRDEGFDVACGMAATSPESSNLLSVLTERYPDERYAKNEFGRLNLSAQSGDQDDEAKSHSDGDCQSPFHQSDDGLKRSCVDSGVGVSTHSDLSALCKTPPADENASKEDYYSDKGSNKNFRDFEYRQKDGSDQKVASLLDGFFDFSDGFLSDEQFVTKCVLAEQICSSPHSRCPVQHKLMISRARHLLIASYIFSAQLRNSNTVTYAISFLMSHERQDWYMERQCWFEKVICDSVPKLKASLFSEDSDDILVRSTSELTRLMSLLSALERFSLISPERPLMVKNSFFADSGSTLTENRLLSRAISGCLQSQGHCVIIGSDHLLVTKMLHTLAFFVPEEWQWCCLRPYRHKYNAYVQLQVIKRIELPTLVHTGAASSWPICVIDLDRSAVCMSAPYSRHRVLRARNDSRGVRLILEHAGVMSSSATKAAKAPQLELSTCRTLDCVNTFLCQMDELPVEESLRRGFCAQLMLYVTNAALAFICYVRDASAPMDDEKECGTRSKRFSLYECRKALNLTNDAWFNAVLARAEHLKPDIAEFIYM